MRGFVRALMIAICLLAVVSLAHAGSIYDNINSVTAGSDPVGIAWGPLGDSFFTPSGGFLLGEVDVLLSGAPSAGSTTVSLYSDASTLPGGSLLTIGTLSDNLLTNTLSVFSFSLTSPYALAGNTRYWIVLSADPVNDTTAYWGWSLDQTALGVAGEFYSNYGGTGTWRGPFANTGGPYQMELIGTPEPSTFLLLGSGILGIAGVLRRRFLP